MSTAEDVDRAFRAAADAFENGWRDSTPAERQIILNKIADAVEERADELVAAEVENCGKPVKATREEEIWQVTDALRFFAGAARVLEGKAAGEYMADHTSWIRREPIGVVGAITPWNYPMAMTREDRTGARCGQHHRPRRPTPRPSHSAARRDRRRIPAARRVQRRHW